MDAPSKDAPSKDEGKGEGPGQKRCFTSVKEAAQERSLGVGGNPKAVSPRQASRVREGDRWVAAKSGFSCHLASPPFPAF